MTKAQEVYERVEALVASGEKKADAFKRMAEEYEQPLGSVRGAYYSYSRSLGGTPRTGKTRVEVDPVEQAVSVLEKALTTIDEQIAQAKARAETAKSEYEHLRETAGERKQAVQAKIDALKA